MDWPTAVSIIAAVAGFAFFAWLIMRAEPAPRFPTPAYRVLWPEHTWNSYTGPAICPHCGKRITAADLAAWADGQAEDGAP